MLETFQMKACHDRQLFHRQLFRRLLIALALAALDLGSTTEMLLASKSLEAFEQRLRAQI